jgi:hypothetical protein
MLPLRRNCKICSRVSVGTRPCALPQVEHVPSFRHLGSPRSWAGCQFSTTDCVPRKKCSSCEVKSKIIRYCEFCLASILPSPVPVCSSPTETGLCIVGLPRQCIVGLPRQCIVGLPRRHWRGRRPPTMMLRQCRHCLCTYIGIRFLERKFLRNSLKRAIIIMVCHMLCWIITLPCEKASTLKTIK